MITKYIVCVAITSLLAFQTTARDTASQSVSDSPAVSVEPGSHHRLENSKSKKVIPDDPYYWVSTNRSVGIVDYRGRSPWLSSEFVAVNVGTTTLKAFNSDSELIDSFEISVTHRNGSFTLEAESYTTKQGDLSVGNNRTRGYLATNNYISSGHLQYEFTAPETGTYEMIYNHSINGGKFHASINSNTYSHTLPFPYNIYNAHSYRNYNAGHVNLVKGTNTMTLSFTGNKYGIYPLFVDYFIFRKVNSNDPATISPETIAASSIDNELPIIKH